MSINKNKQTKQSMPITLPYITIHTLIQLRAKATTVSSRCLQCNKCHLDKYYFYNFSWVTEVKKADFVAGLSTVVKGPNLNLYLSCIVITFQSQHLFFWKINPWLSLKNPEDHLTTLMAVFKIFPEFSKTLYHLDKKIYSRLLPSKKDF